MARDYNAEARDLDDRKYAYDFDYIHRDYMIQAFSPFMNGGRALELGCYKGEFTKLLRRHYSDLTVVEAADELIREASANVGPGVRFVKGLFEDVSLEGQFDAIFLIHTVEHLDDPVPVLKRINSWLATGGQLFLVAPNANAPSRQIAVKMGLITHNAAVTPGEFTHGHRRTYSLDTLERDARTAGLHVDLRGGILFKPLANFQFDQAMKAGIIGKDFVEGCYQLGMVYPDLCASVYLLCSSGR